MMSRAIINTNLVIKTRSRRSRRRQLSMIKSMLIFVALQCMWLQHQSHAHPQHQQHNTNNQTNVNATIELDMATTETETTATTTRTPNEILKAAATTTTTVSMPAEFKEFYKSLNHINDELCRRDLNATIWGILQGYPWATAMYDASAKSSVGLESAVLQQFGHYDQCLNQPQRLQQQQQQQQQHRSYDHHHHHDHDYDHDVHQQFSDQAAVRAQYCLVRVHMTDVNVHDISSRTKKKQSMEALWGVCVPDTCSPRDVEIHVAAWLHLNVTMASTQCQTPAMHQLQPTNGMLAYAIVLCFFVILAILSTLYHCYLLFRNDDDDDINKDPGKTLTMALLSFSIIENTRKLFQPSKDQLGLNSINGIKALAMLLILSGHALSFILGSSMYNTRFINEQLQLPTFSFLTNSLLFVDTFLLLSGFLFCRILLIELERRRGKLNVLVLYIARYIRLTPAYMAVIGFYMTWLPHVGSGPNWPQRIALEQQRCQKSWWLNILYINNYINTDQLCMFQSWYLSVDSQLFFVAPIVIYILYKSRTMGLRFLYALVLIAGAIPFMVTYLNKLDPTLMVYADEVQDLGRNDFYIGSYIKTHMRASAYVIGLLVGYLVHVIQEKRIVLPPQMVRCLWWSSVFIGIGSMYGVTRFYVAPYTPIESSLYAGFHKVGWNLSVGWLVLSATTGHAGWLQRALSIRFFAPISRLTYCAYLSNGIVELYHMASIRQPHYMSFLSLTNDVFSHTLDTFMLAIVLCLLFESPIHALERILLRSYGGNGGKDVTANGQTQQQNSGAEGKETPSTSEEQIA